MGIPTTHIAKAIDEGKVALANIGDKIHHSRKIGWSPDCLLSDWQELFLLIFALDGWDQNSDGTVPDSVDNPFTQVEMEDVVSRIHKLATQHGEGKSENKIKNFTKLDGDLLFKSNWDRNNKI